MEDIIIEIVLWKTRLYFVIVTNCKKKSGLEPTQQTTFSQIFQSKVMHVEVIVSYALP